jgi:hypothetical protein
MFGAAASGIAADRFTALENVRPTQPGQVSAAGLKCPPMDRVRVGCIGVGARGSGHVEQMLMLDGVEIVAIADNYAPNAQRSAKACVDKKRSAPALFTDGDYGYRRMLERDDLDVVLIATPWEWHAKMAVDTMRAGKHAFVEVPAACTLDECWDLVDTSEQTQKHCMMLENVCYGREELMVLNMCRKGALGELLHGEAAYIHDLRGQMYEVERGTGSWRTIHYTKRNGNLYPTHGLGPVCQYMGINRGDRMDYLSSVSCNARVREIFAKKNFPADHKWNKVKFVCGDINSTIVRTVGGKTILIQWDEQLPRPYNRLNLIQGTKGVWGGFPDRVVLEGKSASTDSWEMADKLTRYYGEFDHPLWRRVGEEAVKAGGHGGMDFVMLWRLVYCLRNGLPLDQDVYDAASWSSISPLSEASVRSRGKSMSVPDFTRGKWKAMRPLEIVS